MSVIRKTDIRHVERDCAKISQDNLVARFYLKKINCRKTHVHFYPVIVVSNPQIRIIFKHNTTFKSVPFLLVYPGLSSMC